MIERLLHRERGVALIMAVSFMALSLPLVLAALHLASALTVDSRVKTGILKSQYSGLGGNQYGIFKLTYDPDFIDDLPVGTPTSTTVTLNDQIITINLVKAADAPHPVPPKALNSRRLRVLKVVTPATTTPSVTTTFTYTIAVDNRDDQPENLTKIKDKLPPGFGYVSNSAQFTPPGGPTSGLEPSISGQDLTWNIAPLSVTLQPAEVAILIFDATANVAEGTYCNEAWADPGDSNTQSGKTAVVVVGSPTGPSALCSGPAVILTKTVDPATSVFGAETLHTYTIKIQNIGTIELDMTRIRDFLPGCTDPCSVATEGFVYQLASTGGNITSNDPNTKIIQQTQAGVKTYRQRLDWNFSDDFEIPSGQTSTLTYVVAKKAGVTPGDKWNEVLVSIDQFGTDGIYSWPTAPVSVRTVVVTCSSDGESSVSSEVWVGIGSADVQWAEFLRDLCP